MLFRPRLIALWRNLVRRDRVERELDEELSATIDLLAAEQVRAGMHPEEARRSAMVALGGIEAVKEQVREARAGAAIETFLQDVRYGLRLLRRAPGFAAVVIGTLALGIGANAAIFHLIDTLVLRSLPIANPQEIVEVRADGPEAFGSYEGANARATYPLWEQIRSHQTAFATVFAWGDASFRVGRGADARNARGLWVSGEFFPALGIVPERGRLLGPADDRRGCGAGAAVISHAFWQAHWGGRESAIGSTLTLRDQPFTVVGITPPSFTGLEVGERFDVAVPVCSAALWESWIEQRDRWWLTVMGRLKPDWTAARANDQLRALSPGLLEATTPPGYDAGLLEGYRRLRFGVIPAGRGVSRLREAYGTSLSLLLGLTGLVLLITCGNVATLMLARASAREREIVVRMAIGASRMRLVSQMLIESLLVAAAGAVLAVPVAVLASRALVAFLDTPARSVDLNLTTDWRLIAFVGTIATSTAVLFGLLPAIRVSTVDPIAGIRQASRSISLDRQRARLQRALVVVQVAVSLVLVVSALLFIQSLRNLSAVDLGFEPHRTIVVTFSDRASERLPVEWKAAFQAQLTGEIRSVPGVAAAAASTHVPMSGAVWAHFFRVPGVGGHQRKASRFAYVSPGYFDALQIPIRLGRDFNDLDNASSRRVMLVNESFVRAHLAGQHPLGATLRTIAEPGFPETTYDVIGVVGDTKYAGLRDEHCWCKTGEGAMVPMAYVPIEQNPSPYAWAPVIVRARTSVAGIAPAIRQRVARLNPAIVLDFVELESQVRDHLRRERMLAWLAGGFGALATLLVIVGVYGIIAYLAAGRRHEIGIRLALGSTRAQIVRLVLSENVWLIGAGLAIGLPLAIAAMQAATALLFGLTPTDVPTLVRATCLLALTAVAGALPAWRAARVRPDLALRCD